MKEYTFFIACIADDKKRELTTSTVSSITVPNYRLLSEVTIVARDNFIREVEKKHSMRVTLITQFNLIGIQDVYEDENGEIKVKEVSNED